MLSSGSMGAWSEADCLTLNVWTPSCDDHKRPVMFFIHGGSYLFGESSTPIYDGSRFAADHDLVVVSCNYRLGVLGFTHVAKLAGADFEGSGVAGILDAQAALRWVRANIAGFGGDADNVTIFGESAGATSVGVLLAMPSARGLFRRAILQSGAMSSCTDETAAARTTAELCDAVGCAHDLRALQAVPVEDLLVAQYRLLPDHVEDASIAAPVVDGNVLPMLPIDAVAKGSAAGVEILVGTNLDEWRIFSFTDPAFIGLDEEVLEARVARRYPGDAARAIEVYRRRLSEPTAARVLESVTCDRVFRAPALALAEGHFRAGGAVWMYLLTWASTSFGGGLGAAHTVDLPIVFNTVDAPAMNLLLGEELPRELASAVNATWAAFARHGDPGRGALGPWPSYDLAARRTMVIDEPCRIVEDPLADERALW